MGNYYDEESRGNARQRDFVLNMNEFAYILSKTDGNIKCAVGPFQTSLSQQEVPVLFNTKSKKFEECNDYERAKQLFVSAPEGWYIVLKNPTEDNRHPEQGRANVCATNIKIGKKINVFGPTSFALYPGQMSRVIQGHRLKSNQYLIARVYDADAANKNEGIVTDADGKEQKTGNQYFTGQLLVIKGTEVSFYMPPTGIEVIAENGNYVRDAVTLERLEYCILKDENGNKRYVHGPTVEFPKPTETFVKAPHGGFCFRAIELSKISGIYVKVIAEYTEDKVKHPIGEELFITGEKQMIYYPRPEHAIISYDGKMLHHAIAIPAGEGRYVMNRETGEIKTVIGPKMYLPDPRKEVIVKRKLTAKQCELWYPGNKEVLEYNDLLSEKSVEKSSMKRSVTDMLYNSAFSDAASMAELESNASISRGTSYTKPRTITLDNKYDGVVAVDVWTGYAINVISKNGAREVVVGPATKLLDYDQTMEVLQLSTGRPKTTDTLEKTVYLRVKNNKVSDLIKVQTKDYVNVQIKVSYCVDFLDEYKDKWFSVENYIKYMCDRQRSLLKREARKYNIEDFYANATDIVRKITICENAETEVVSAEDATDVASTPVPAGRFFAENGMLVHDVEVLSVSIEEDVAAIMEEHQEEMIRKCLELTDATRKAEIVEQLAKYEKRATQLEHENKMYKLELEKKAKVEAQKAQAQYEAEDLARKQAIKDAEAKLQITLDTIHRAQLERDMALNNAKVEYERNLAKIDEEKQNNYAANIKTIMESISEDLVAAMTTKSNNDMVTAMTKSMSPYALAQGNESVTDVTNKILRGTGVDEFIKNLAPKAETKVEI